MKLTVITGKAGKIIGTYRPAATSKPEVGTGGPIAGPSQAVRTIDLPKELENVGAGSACADRPLEFARTSW